MEVRPMKHCCLFEVLFALIIFFFVGSETEAMHSVIITVMCILAVAACFEILRRYSKHLPSNWQARLGLQRAAITG